MQIQIRFECAASFFAAAAAYSCDLSHFSVGLVVWLGPVWCNLGEPEAKAPPTGYGLLGTCTPIRVSRVPFIPAHDCPLRSDLNGTRTVHGGLLGRPG